MPDMTGLLWFFVISGAVSALLMNGGFTGWLLKTIATFARSL